MFRTPYLWWTMTLCTTISEFKDILSSFPSFTKLYHSFLLEKKYGEVLANFQPKTPLENSFLLFCASLIPPGLKSSTVTTMVKRALTQCREVFVVKNLNVPGVFKSNTKSCLFFDNTAFVWLQLECMFYKQSTLMVLDTEFVWRCVDYTELATRFFKLKDTLMLYYFVMSLLHKSSLFSKKTVVVVKTYCNLKIQDISKEDMIHNSSKTSVIKVYSNKANASKSLRIPKTSLLDETRSALEK